MAAQDEAVSDIAARRVPMPTYALPEWVVNTPRPAPRAQPPRLRRDAGGVPPRDPCAGGRRLTERGRSSNRIPSADGRLPK